VTAGAVTALTCLLAAACSSSGTSSASSASTGSSTASPASTSLSSVMAEAQQLAAPFQKQPTTLEVTVPITKPIPTGKKLDFLTCSSPGCAVIAARFVTAAGILGWHVKVLTVAPSADAIVSAYNTAIRDKPDGVAVAAVSAEVARPELATLQSMHIPVVTVQDPDVKFGPIIASLYTHASSYRLGKVTADELTALGCGKGTTIYVNLSGYLVLQFRLTYYEAEMKRLDPAMKYKVLNFAATDTNFVSGIVGAVRSDPSVDCIYASSDPIATGLPQALKAAGVSPLPKIITDYAGNTTLSYIHSGLATATDIGDSGSYGFIYIDTFARYWAGQSLAPDENALQTIWFVDSSNAPATVPYSDIANLSADYAKLWGKS
jgi:ribose transport system substrate-binding protein